VRTVLAGAVVVTCDEEHTVFDPGDVVLEDDTICYVGPSYQESTILASMPAANW
jgi:cytosine/adenosine deaminase-related metal-dependent hydrolase